MRPLYFVSARDALGQTVWAAHLYAASPAAARKLGAVMRERDFRECHPVTRSHLLAMPLTWHARKSASYANAMNA